MSRKKFIFISIFIFIIIAYLLIIIISSFFTSKRTGVEEASITPTPYYQKGGSLKASIVPLAGDQIDKMMDDLIVRKPILGQDIIIREELAKKSKPDQSGIIYSTPNFEVYYAKDTDVFQVQITGNDSLLAQNESVNWFKQQGFSIEAICDLPVVYLKLPKDNGIFFYPQPKECTQQ